MASSLARPAWRRSAQECVLGKTLSAAQPCVPIALPYHPFKWRGSGTLVRVLWAIWPAIHEHAVRRLRTRKPIAVKATTSGHNTETVPVGRSSSSTLHQPRRAQPAKSSGTTGSKKPDLKMLAGKWKRAAVAIRIHRDQEHRFADRGSGGFVAIRQDFLTDDYGAEYRLATDSNRWKSSSNVFAWPSRNGSNAIKGGKPAWSNFQEYAGKLTEVICWATWPCGLQRKQAGWLGGRKAPNWNGIKPI